MAVTIGKGGGVSVPNNPSVVLPNKEGGKVIVTIDKYGNPITPSRGGGSSRTPTPEEIAANQKAEAEAKAKAEAEAKAQADKQRQLQQDLANKRAAALKTLNEQVKSNPRVFYSEEKTRIEQGRKIAQENQFKPKDFNPETDTVVYYSRSGTNAGQSTKSVGAVNVEKGINVKGEAGTQVAKEIKRLTQEQMQVGDNIVFKKVNPISKQVEEKTNNKLYNVETGEEYKPPFSLFGTIDKGLYGVSGWISDKISNIFPEGKVKSFLFDKKYDAPPISQFIFFAPATATSVEVTANLIKQGVLVPESRTSFIATTKNLGNGFTKVDVISKTTTGTRNTFGLSSQVVKEGEVSASKGVQFLVKGSKNKVEVSKLNLLGLSKDVGNAQAVRESTSMTLRKDIGQGSQSAVLSQEVQRIAQGKSYPFNKVNLKTNPNVVRNDIIGSYKDINENAVGFVGQTGKGILRIYKSGRVTKVLDNPNVRGIILKDSTPEYTTDSVGNVIITKGKKLSSAIKDKILSNVGGLATSGASKNIAEGTKAISTSGGIKLFGFVSAVETPKVDIGYPTMTGNAVLEKPSQSAFAGTGQYEKTNEVVSPITNMGTTQSVNEVNILKVTPIQTLGSSGRQRPKERNIPIQKPIQEESTRTKESVVNIPSFKFRESSKQRSKTSQIFRPPQKNVPRDTFKMPPVLKTEKRGNVQRFIEDNFGSFEAFTKKAGKEVSLGKKRSQEEAEGLLKNVLRSSLRASGFITKGGEKLKSSELKGFGSNVFTKSKTNPFSIVEKKEKRLTKGGQDVREIKAFKKKSKNIFGL